MKLKPKIIIEFQEIMKKDYDTNLSKEDANDLGKTLLRLSKLGISVLTRVDKNNLSLPVRGRKPLKSNTSTQECVPLQALGLTHCGACKNKTDNGLAP